MFKDSDVYVSGDISVDKIYCSGNILIEDLGNRYEEHEYQRIKTGASNLHHWSNTITANELFIEGNIIFNERIYNENDVFQLINCTIDDINPKIVTIRCNNFLMGHKLIIKENYIHTTNNEVVTKLRQLKINKLKKND